MTFAFETDYAAILHQLKHLDIRQYAATRNFVDGAVTRLSPYISRGVISTKQVFDQVMSQGHSFSSIEKFIQELAWRDYWQQLWVENGEQINHDLKRPQPSVKHHLMPTAIINANCKIEAIDQAISQMYQNGYMHNHVRMYTAFLACNLAKSHWLKPAKWMYYHLLDGDWASNALSWQWVAGANANKQYIANQDNINKYCRSTQKNSYLDVSYEELAQLPIPAELIETDDFCAETQLPATPTPTFDNNLPTLIYNYYNLDPVWRKQQKVNRVLLLEPSVFAQYPVADKNIEFVLALAKNIEGLQVFSGEFSQLQQLQGNDNFIYKEHPLNRHYQGQQDERDWMFPVYGGYPSFFAFWKKCKKTIKD